MCKAVEEMINESEERGELRMLVKQVRKGRVTVEEAAEDAEMTVEEFVYWCVRRLTPKECERLQGYPDFWTVLRKIATMTDEEYEFYKAAYITDKEIKGKTVRRIPTKKQLINWHNKLDVDGTRYRQLGNSLAIPCALRVIGYIADYIREGAGQDEGQ